MITVDLMQEKYYDIYNALRRAFLEFQGHQNVVMYMISNKLQDNKNFSTYWEKYLDAIMAYENMKKQLEEFVIYSETNNAGGTWSVDFQKHIVNITVNVSDSND